MFKTEGQIARSLVAAGFSSDIALALANLSRASVRLYAEVVADEDSIPIGATKIGGRPDLPASAAWPMRPAMPDVAAAHLESSQAADSRWSWATADQRELFRQELKDMAALAASPFPLTFVAQIDFAQIAETGSSEPNMPRSGVLSLFYDVIEQPWGFDPKDSRGWSVLYHETDNRTRHDIPDLLASASVTTSLKPMACQLHPFLSPIVSATATFDALALDQAQRDLYWDWEVAHFETVEQPDNRVGGWPNPVQGDMQVQSALVAAGIYTGDSDAYRDPGNAAIRASGTDWVMLVQIDSPEEAGMMWGDSGKLYLWIKREDLAAGRFDAVHLIQQSY